MHHVPTGPSRSTRLRRLLPRRRATVLGLLLGCLVAGLLAVAVPVLPGAASGGPVALHATASTGPRVVMGVDGAPARTAGAGSVPPGSAAPGSAGAAGTPDPATTGAPGTVAPGSPAPGTTAAGTAAAGAVTAASTGTAAAGPPAGTPSAGSSTPPPSGTASGSSSPAPVAATVAVTAPSSSSSAPAAAASPAAAQDRSAAVVAALADARATAGCDPLVADAGLAGTAGDHDRTMADDGRTGRDGLDGAPAVVHRGDEDVAAVVAGWLDSSAAREVLLDCTHSRLGAAELTGGDGPWWTAVLG